MGVEHGHLRGWSITVPRSCAECAAPLDGDQRYCLQCGARVGPRAAAVSELLARVATSDRHSAPAGVAAPGPAARRPFALPSPRVGAVLVLAMLGFGVSIGSAASSTVSETLAASRSAPLRILVASSPGAGPAAPSAAPAAVPSASAPGPAAVAPAPASAVSSSPSTSAAAPHEPRGGRYHRPGRRLGPAADQARVPDRPGRPAVRVDVRPVVAGAVPLAHPRVAG